MSFIVYNKAIIRTVYGSWFKKLGIKYNLKHFNFLPVEGDIYR